MPDNNIVKVIRETSEFLEENLPHGFDVSDIDYPNLPFENKNKSKRIRPVWNNLTTLSTDVLGTYSVVRGILNLDVIVPKNTGDVQVLEAAEFLRKAFHGHEFLDLVVEDVLVTPMPEEKDWYMGRVELTYIYEGFNDA